MVVWILRDEVMGTEGTIWINSFLRTGFEMFTTGKGADYVAEKAESNTGWLFPVGDELNELGYNHMFTDMFNAMEEGKAPKETFYDGYVVNRVWMPLIVCQNKTMGTCEVGYLERKNWRNQRKPFNEYDAEYYLVKEEMTHYGAKKVILKNKKTKRSQRKFLNKVLG